MLGANNTISTKRLVSAAGLETYGRTALITGLQAYIVKAKPEVAMMFDGINAYDVFSCYIEGNHDIIISDLVTDILGTEYVVKDLETYINNTDVPDQMTLTLFKKYSPDE